jgi:hypothetical protein
MIKNSKTHCVNGHEFTIENSYFNNQGSRLCRVCLKEKSRLWRKANPNYQKKYVKGWYERHPYYDKIRRLKNYHGITLEQYNIMLEEQDGKCAICGTIEPSGKGNFHVDHNHKTDSIRKLLCSQCNVGIGMFKENINLLSSAIIYLAEQG